MLPFIKKNKMETNIENTITKDFLCMPLRPYTMPFYSIRTSILQSIKESSLLFYGTVLDVGCGIMPYKSIVLDNEKVTKYVGMDLEQPTYYGHIEPDLKWNGKTIPLENETVECVMATEVLEHHAEPQIALNEIHRVMKKDGVFFATVPFIWHLHELPNDEYRYTPFSLERLLKDAGFINIKIKSLGGWNMALAQMIGLWIGFSPMGRIKRKIMRILLFPFFVLLVKTDKKPTSFEGYENSMFSGLYVSAQK